jgi:hypothetical protein
MEKLTKEVVQRKTLEILKKDDLDVSYITQELVDSDNNGGHTNGEELLSSDTEGAPLLTLWGNNARYGTVTINGQNWQCYYYEYGGNAPTSNRNLACGTNKTFYLLMQDWHHTYDGNCQSGRERWRFDRA